MVTHEIGHALGLDAHEVLSPTIDPGVRTTPAPSSTPDHGLTVEEVADYAWSVVATEGRIEGADEEKDDWASWLEEEFELSEIDLD